MCTNLPAAWIVPQGVVCRQRKRWENQSSSDNKRSVSVYKLTSCIDCATGCCWQARKEMGKSIKFRQQEVSECVQTYRLHAWIVPQGVVCRQRKRWENQSSSDNKRSVSVYKLTGCIDCATECCLQARKEINQVQTTRGQ